MKIRDENGWELVSHDEAIGRTVWKYSDGNATHYRTDYRTSKLVDQNKAALLDSYGKPLPEWNRVASIPLNVYFEQLAEAQAQQDDGYIAKWINSSDHRAFRTSRGRV